MTSLRVLMLTKAALVGAYQSKLELIGQVDGVDLLAVVPPYWDDPAGRVDLERSHTQGYTLLADPIRFNGQYHLYHYPKLKQRIEAFQPHIVHIDEEPYNLATWLAWRQARSYGAKSLFFSWQNIEKRYPFPFRTMEKQVLEGVDFAIMGNRDSVEVFRHKGYRGHYEIIPQFGVDPAFFHPPSYRDSGKSFVIGSANRRLVYEKGVDLLLQAAAQLPGTWQLHIAGEGPEKPKLVQLARDLGISRQVHFDGVIPSQQMPAYLSQLDAHVLSSRTLANWKEQFGRILVEAMASEVPVVGSDSGEIPNVIGAACLIFPEENVGALTAHLLKLMQSAEMRRVLGRAGRQRVLENYTQTQVAARTVAVYQHMVAS